MPRPVLLCEGAGWTRETDREIRVEVTTWGFRGLAVESTQQMADAPGHGGEPNVMESEPMYIEEESLDDLLNSVYTLLLNKTQLIGASKGKFQEHLGAALRLTNPRARLSNSLKRQVPLSALGEFVWYLAGSDDPEFIGAYIPTYRDAPTLNGRVPGAYGPRLFGSPPHDQFDQAVSLLRSHPTSRRAVMQIFRASDLTQALASRENNDGLEVPCTCTIQFLQRDRLLHLMVYMRSSDAYLGLPHDVFCFTMLQELAARALNVECGTYSHFVGSLHLYERHFDAARDYLQEGWHQATPMPAMPSGDQVISARKLVDVERALRQDAGSASIDFLECYWRDLALMLRLKNQWNQVSPVDRPRIIEETRTQIGSDFYRQYLTDRAEAL